MPCKNRTQMKKFTLTMRGKMNLGVAISQKHENKKYLSAQFLFSNS